jgi:hypothetical protein
LNALVERIILDGNRAMGVRYVVDGRDEVALHRRSSCQAAPELASA